MFLHAYDSPFPLCTALCFSYLLAVVIETFVFGSVYYTSLSLVSDEFSRVLCLLLVVFSALPLVFVLFV